MNKVGELPLIEDLNLMRTKLARSIWLRAYRAVVALGQRIEDLRLWTWKRTWGCWHCRDTGRRDGGSFGMLPCAACKPDEHRAWREWNPDY